MGRGGGGLPHLGPGAVPSAFRELSRPGDGSRGSRQKPEVQDSSSPASSQLAWVDPFPLPVPQFPHLCKRVPIFFEVQGQILPVEEQGEATW